MKFRVRTISDFHKSLTTDLIIDPRDRFHEDRSLCTQNCQLADARCQMGKNLKEPETRELLGQFEQLAVLF